MMKDEFMKFIASFRKAHKYCDKLTEVKLPIYESDLFDSYGEVVNKLLKLYFDEEGIDTFYWFVYENHDIVSDFDDNLNMLHKGRLGMFDEKGNPILMDTVEDLWDYLKTCVK